MDTLVWVITSLLYLLVGWPLSLLLHELGHAVMILLFTRQKVVFQFGMRGKTWETHWGRLGVRLYFDASLPFFSRYFVEDYAALSTGQVFWMTLGGPLASLIFTLLFGAAWLATQADDPWRGLAFINLISLLNSSLPRNYEDWQGVQGGIPNDALQLIHLFQKSNTKPA
jgi:hypothetical protein